MLAQSGTPIFAIANLQSTRSSATTSGIKVTENKVNGALD